MALNRKYLGIKFPITTIGEEGFFIDMEHETYKELKSDLIHLIFTPKGQRYRNPEFGTNLLKYVFEPQDDITYTDIKLEIQESVKKYIPSITIKDIEVLKSEISEYSANITISYSVSEGAFVTNDQINITI